MGAQAGGDYETVLKAVTELPREEQIEVLFYLLNTLLPEGADHGRRLAEGPGQPPSRHTTGRTRKPTLQRALGLLATDRPAPTDAEVEKWLEERRLEKYG